MRLCTLRFVLGCNSIPAGEKLPAKSSLMPPSILTSTRDDILALLTSQDPSSGVRSGSNAAEEQQQFDLWKLPHARVSGARRPIAPIQPPGTADGFYIRMCKCVCVCVRHLARPDAFISTWAYREEVGAE